MSDTGYSQQEIDSIISNSSKKVPQKNRKIPKAFGDFFQEMRKGHEDSALSQDEIDALLAGVDQNSSVVSKEYFNRPTTEQTNSELRNKIDQLQKENQSLKSKQEELETIIKNLKSETFFKE